MQEFFKAKLSLEPLGSSLQQKWVCWCCGCSKNKGMIRNCILEVEANSPVENQWELDTQELWKILWSRWGIRRFPLKSIILHLSVMGVESNPGWKRWGKCPKESREHPHKQDSCFRVQREQGSRGNMEGSMQGQAGNALGMPCESRSPSLMPLHWCQINL